MLRAVGHPAWSVDSDEAYVQAAVALASDRARLASLRAGLRSEVAASVLGDHPGQARRFSDALRVCWQQWCARAAAKAA